MHTRIHHSGCKTKLMSLENYLEKTNKKRIERSQYNSAHRSISKKNAAGSAKGICHLHLLYEMHLIVLYICVCFTGCNSNTIPDKIPSSGVSWKKRISKKAIEQ